MRIRFVVLGLAALALARPAAAQKTEDQARLIFTVGLSYTGSSDLWSVTGQPILRPAIGSDTVDITRDIGGSIGMVFSGMYFPKPSLGFVGEAFFMGIGLHDQCTVTSFFPDPRTEDICSDIDGHSKSSSAVLLSAGPVLRAASSQEISPYVRAQVGMLISNLSPVRTEGTVSTGDIFVVYDDPSSTRVTLGFVFGAGATAVLGKGWQARLEARDNLVEIATVAGPTGAGDANPEIVNQWKNLFSIVLGVDVVLEKKRGHRY
jgi:hypothetical protein